MFQSLIRFSACHLLNHCGQTLISIGSGYAIMPANHTHPPTRWQATGYFAAVAVQCARQFQWLSAGIVSRATYAFTNYFHFPSSIRFIEHKLCWATCREEGTNCYPAEPLFWNPRRWQGKKGEERNNSKAMWFLFRHFRENKLCLSSFFPADVQQTSITRLSKVYFRVNLTASGFLHRDSIVIEEAGEQAEWPPLGIRLNSSCSHTQQGWQEYNYMNPYKTATKVQRRRWNIAADIIVLLLLGGLKGNKGARWPVNNALGLLLSNSRRPAVWMAVWVEQWRWDYNQDGLK